MEYDVTRRIEAPADQVWETLLDVSAWPTWDSGVSKVEGATGRATDGDKLTVHSEVAPGRAFPVRAEVDSAGHTMTFTGGMPLGLFRGVRTYTVTPEGDGASVFRMHEVYSGPLLGPISKRMPDLQPSFDKFADGLRARCEQN